MTESRLPLVARLILRALVPSRWRDSVEGDLLEEQEGRGLRALRVAARLRLEEAFIRPHDRVSEAPSARRRFSMEMLLVEIRQAARALLRRPAYSMLAVATLAIGIGANAVVFTMANWLLFRPIAGVDAPDRLVTIRFGSTEGFLFPLSEPDRADIETTIPSFGAVAGYQTIALHVAASPDAQARRLDAQVVSGNYFDVLGPAVVHAGRTFAPNERTDSAAALVAVISHRMWQQDFGRAPTAIGSPMLINGQRFTVIGIAAPGFHGSERSENADLWVPAAAHPVVMPNYPVTALTSRRATIFFGLIARLRDAATAQSASSELEVLRTRLLAEDPSNRRLQMSRYLVDEGLTARAWERDRLSRVFAMLLGTVGLLLMLTCANVSNLMLARATARRAELATRQALGASRARIAVQWLLESLLLSSAGCALALAGAAWTASLMRGVIILPGIPGLGDVSLDARVLLFAVGLSTVTAAAAAVLPAMTADRQDLLTALKTSSRTLAPGRRRVRQALMVAQVALSLALLVGAFLLARSMHERRSIDPGFDLARVLTFTIEPGLQGLNGERKGAFYTALTARLRELPAVSGASLAWIRPYAMILDDADVRAGDAPDGAAVNAERNWVGSGYFATMGIGLIDGREFTGSELHRSENVPPHTVIINEPLARRLFGISHAAGRSIVLARGVRAEVVGVVKGTRSRRLNEPPPLQMYSPFGRRDWASIVVRVDAPVAAVLPQIREAVRGLDKSLPIYDVMTLGDTVERHLSEDALVTRLTGTFAILATLLASIGLYGVLSQAVAERRPEFGIRAALGAAPGHVLTMVLSDALRVTLVGSALGAILAFWLVRFIEGRLFGIRPFDPWSYGAAVTGVLAVALLAAFLPARRAAGVDPVIALRE